MNLLFWYRSLMRSVGATLVKLIATATSGLVSFTTNVIRPVKVTCEFSPVQEGTGDPSPDNVRPISGWTGCEVPHSGNNLFGGDAFAQACHDTWNATIRDGEDGKYWVKSNGGISNTLKFGDYFKVKENTQYTFLFDMVGNLDAIFFRVFYTDGAYTYISTPVTRGRVKVVSTANKTISSMNIMNRAAERTIYFDSSGVFEGNVSDDDFESYRAVTTTITFTNPSTGDPMTVYGGTVTLNEDGSADLVQTMAMRNASQLGFARFSSTYADPDNNIYGPALSVGSLFKDSGRVETAYSNVAKSGAGKTGHNFQIAGLFYLSIYSPTPLTTGAEALAYLESIGFYVVGTLNEPVTYHFDNIGQLQSFLGTNNIWHNMNGSITAEYYKKQ